jgi:hypothetical protein
MPGSESTALIRLNGALQKVNDYIDHRFGKKRTYANPLNGGAAFHAQGNAAGRAAADRMPIGRKGVTGGGGSRGQLGGGE